MAKKKIYIDGCMWEDEAWIEFNRKISELGGGEPCKHCYGHKIKENVRHDGSTWTEAIWYCPRVIVATNEGGCNSTGVCLDCVIEAANELETKPPEELEELYDDDYFHTQWNWKRNCRRGG